MEVFANELAGDVVQSVEERNGELLGIENGLAGFDGGGNAVFGDGHGA